MFYVYVLYRDEACTQPFYVGKGSGARYKRHAYHAETGRGSNRLKNNIAAKCLRDFGHVPYRIERADVSEVEAFALERALITLWGRRDLGLGPLANATDGGEGTSGHQRSPEVIEALRAWNTGSKRTPEQRAKMSAWQVGRKMPEEAVEKMRASKIGTTWSPERRQAAAGVVPVWLFTPEVIAKRSEAAKGRVFSDETRAKMSAAAKDRDPATRSRAPKSAETRAKISVSVRATGYVHPPEVLEKMRGRTHSPETRARMTLAQKERWAKRKEASAMAEAGA